LKPPGRLDIVVPDADGLQEQAFVLISSYYSDPFDGQFALRLRESARLLSIECDLFKWDKGAAEADRAGLRCKLLARNLLERPGENVLFVDPEAQLQRRPQVLLDEEDFDVGVYYDLRTMEITGPIFLRNNSRTIRMVRDWQVMNQSDPDASELENLSQLLSRPGSEVQVRRLPVTYAWVERLHRELHPTARPVIVHFKTDGLITSRIRLARK
jgi:hypothetical protein